MIVPPLTCPIFDLIDRNYPYTYAKCQKWVEKHSTRARYIWEILFFGLCYRISESIKSLFKFRYISSTFSVLQAFSYLRNCLYFDLFTKTVLQPKPYFNQNRTSTCTSRPIRSTDLTHGRSTELEVRESR